VYISFKQVSIFYGGKNEFCPNSLDLNDSKLFHMDCNYVACLERVRSKKHEEKFRP
jgi:hypothetical protein